VITVLVVHALGAAALAIGGPLAVLAVLGAVWAPGLAWSRRLSGDPLQAGIDAAWIGLLQLVLSLFVVRALAGGPWALYGLGSAWLVGGLLLRRAPLRRPEPAVLVGVGGVLLGVLAVAGGFRGELTRPLDAYWYHAAADDEGFEAVPWSAADGFGDERRLGWEEAGAGAVHDPDGDGGDLLLPEGGRVVLLLRGPVGASFSVGDQTAIIQRDVIEAEQPEAVPRYLDHGMAGMEVRAAPGPLTIRVSSSEAVTLYVLPGSDAVWSLDESGEVRFVHYYQLLNIVENQRWAAEFTVDRWITVNQPPLWSPLLASTVLFAGNGLVEAAGLYLLVLLLVGVSGVRVLALAAPRAPIAAWLLPGAFVAVHGKLMILPGSWNFPDSLYTAALLGGVAALFQHQRQPLRFAAMGLAAGLIRYPGTIVLTVAAALYAVIWRRMPWRAVGALWGTVVGVGAVLAALAVVSGDFREWLFILWFETFPEHYHGDYAASSLLPRVPEFYGTWLRYAGFAPLLALPLAGRPSKLLWGTAVAYSTLLCTIDHFPTHYFLPLVALSGLAVAANAAALSGPVRQLPPALALAGATWFFLTGAT